MNDYLLWVDCEMSGLNIDSDILLEVAIMLTKGINKFDEGISLILNVDTKDLNMCDEVLSLHKTSGLLKDLNDNNIKKYSLKEAEELLIKYITDKVNDPYILRKIPICGNTVFFDKIFLNKYMNTLTSMISYRYVDITSFKLVSKIFNPENHLNKPYKDYNHRALSDVYESYSEFLFYLDTLIKRK